MFTSDSPDASLSPQALKSLGRMALMSKNYSSHRNLLDARAALSQGGKEKGGEVPSEKPPRASGSRSSMKRSKSGLPEINVGRLSIASEAEPSPADNGSFSLPSPILTAAGTGTKFPALAKSPEYLLMRSGVHDKRRDEAATMPASAQVLELLRRDQRNKQSDADIVGRLDASIRSSISRYTPLAARPPALEVLSRPETSGTDPAIVAFMARPAVLVAPPHVDVNPLDEDESDAQLLRDLLSAPVSQSLRHSGFDMGSVTPIAMRSRGGSGADDFETALSPKAREVLFAPRTPRSAYDESIHVQKNKYFRMYRTMQQLGPNEQVSEQSAKVTLLRELAKEKMLPQTLGLTRNHEDVLDLSCYGMGDKLAKVLIACAPKLPPFTVISLKQNRLSGPTLTSLLAGFNFTNLMHLDVSSNSVGDSGALGIAVAIQQSATTLTYVNVEGNELSDNGMAKVCRALQYCQYLECAVLRENRLGERAAVELAVAIGGSSMRNGREVPLLPSEEASRKANGGVWNPPVNPHSSLRSLDIAWNSCGVVGSAHVFRALAINTSVHTLDIAWNGVGGSRSKAAPAGTSAGIAALCEMVQANTTLTHLDLSHNSINFSNAQVFANAMRDNHSIRGVHVDGNALTVDPLGFLTAFRSSDAPTAQADPLKLGANSGGVVDDIKGVDAARRGSKASAKPTAEEGIGSVDESEQPLPSVDTAARLLIDSAAAFVEGALGAKSQSSHHYIEHGAAYVWEADQIVNSREVDSSFTRRIVPLRTVLDSVPATEVKSAVNTVVSVVSVADLEEELGLSEGKHTDVIAHLTSPKRTRPLHATVHTADMCWICGEWRQLTFRWCPPVSGPIANSSVTLRASFDNWAPVPMIPKDDGTWEVDRMVPSTRVYFMYEVDGIPRIAEDERFEPTKLGIHSAKEILRELAASAKSSLYYDDDGYIRCSSAKFVNVIPSVQEQAQLAELNKKRLVEQKKENQKRLKAASSKVGAVLEFKRQASRFLAAVGHVVDAKDAKGADSISFAEASGIAVTPLTTHIEAPGLNARSMMDMVTQNHAGHGHSGVVLVPRPPPPTAVKPKRPKWTFETSVFAKYREETDALLDKAFEIDWGYGKVARLVKDPSELAAVKAVMRKHYRDMKNTFRHYGGKGLLTDAFNLQWSTFTEFVQDCQVMGPDLSLVDVDNVFIAANVSSQSHKLNPDRSICRFEFLEALVRLGHTKYVRNGDGGSAAVAADAICVAMEQFAAHDFNAQKWRREKFWTEKNDMLFRQHLKELEQVFSTFAGRFPVMIGRVPLTIPGKMSIFDFMAMMQFTALMDELVTERDLKFAFVNSLMFEVDEMNSGGRHMLMSQVEFYEALGRVAKSIKTLPSFTKKLAIVLTAVSGLVDPYSSLFLSEKALKAIVHPAAARVQESQLERKATGIAIDFQAADMAVLATQASTPAASTLTSSSPE